jgi:hypothetical protein
METGHLWATFHPYAELGFAVLTMFGESDRGVHAALTVGGSGGLTGG